MAISSQASEESVEGSETSQYGPNISLRDVQERRSGSMIKWAMNDHERGGSVEKTCRKCEIVKSLDEFYRDKKSKDGKHSYCKECERARRRQYHWDNHEKSTATSRKWKAENAARNKGLTAKWRIDNVVHMKRYQAKYRSENRELVNKTHREWCRANPKKKAANDWRRRSRLAQATPDWVTDEDLAPFYMQAAMMEEVTGVKYHVDHIVPICHKHVCGLNVPWNLQVITGAENCRKGNTFNTG